MFSKIATLLSFVRVVRNDAKINDITVDVGGGVNHTAEHFAPAGDDSFPLTSDYVVVTDIPQRNSKAAIGYLDPINEPKTAEGEKRIYARDVDGVPVNEVWLKNDGSVLVANENGSVLLNPDGSILASNGSGSFELQAGGDAVINGVTINTSGEITCNKITTPSAVINGVESATHIHTQANDSGGDTEAPTGIPQ